MKSVPVCTWLTAILLLAAPSARAQGEAAGIEDELQALVRAATRLVENLEKQQALASDRYLEQVQVGVRLLDIRVRQQDGLQRKIDRIDDREQRLRGYIAANEIKLENLKKQISEAIDETSKDALEAQLDERTVYLTNNKNEVEYLSQRRAVLESRMLDGERSVLEIEEMLQSWVTEVQSSQK